MRKNRNIFLFLIIGVVFAASLTHSFYFKIQPQVDALAYDRIAVNLISGNGYVETPNIPIEKDFAITRVGPGYEFFLAGVYFVFGHHYEAVWILQAIFHALSVLFVFLISKEIFSGKWHPIIGLTAAALVGFSPDLIVASSMLLAENLGIFLVLLSVYFFFKYFNRENWSPFFCSAVFLGLASLARSPFVVFALIFAGLFIMRRQWVKLFIFVAIMIAIFSPWVMRNYTVYRQFIPFSSALGYDLWVGNHHGASGELDYFQPLVDYFAEHNPIEVNNYGTQKFFEFVFDHPMEFVKITFQRISVYFSFSRPTGFWPYFAPVQQAITAFFSAIYSVLIFTLGIAGAWLGWKRLVDENGRRFKFLFLMALLTPVSIMFLVVETRYRFPLYPFLALFGGFACYELVKTKAKTGKLVIVFTALSLNTMFDLISNKELIIDRLKNLFL